MSKTIVGVTDDTPVEEIATIMTTHKIKRVPVMRGKKLAGIVSRSDIVGAKGKQVKDIMSKTIVGVTDDTPVEEIATIMTTHKIKRVPVMRGEKLVGIVSRSDIVGAVASGKHIALHTPIYDL
ncbi:MAG: hypothetical protein A2W66_05080 [Deltaproteobacteria bacterium RIFCSPLOWO2_02_56_12]|nr:MAG: hypothetical protein A2W66_05080 [Deltaproteobacteria bacterium RIFCSPLOWO2_02_56_12]